MLHHAGLGLLAHLHQLLGLLGLWHVYVVVATVLLLLWLLLGHGLSKHLRLATWLRQNLLLLHHLLGLGHLLGRLLVLELLDWLRSVHVSKEVADGIDVRLLQLLSLDLVQLLHDLINVILTCYISHRRCVRLLVLLCDVLHFWQIALDHLRIDLLFFGPVL